MKEIGREEKSVICIRCPLGCHISVELADGKIQSITGNTCPRGAEYAARELTDPRRTVTSLVRVRGGEYPVVSVKTAGDIPRDKMRDCAAALKEIVLTAPVRMGDVVLENVCGTGVNMVATADMAKAPET